MSTKINNLDNYKYEINPDYVDTTRIIEFARDHNYEFDTSDLNWSMMCKSKSMKTMKFLDQNKDWICLHTLMYNNSKATLWLLKRVLEDEKYKSNLEIIWNLISSTSTEIAKKMCELHPEDIVWDELSRNRSKWAVELLSKHPEKINKEIFYQHHIDGGYGSNPKIKEILTKYKKDFDLIKMTNIKKSLI